MYLCPMSWKTVRIVAFCNMGVALMLSNTDVWLTAQGMVVVQGDKAVRECENIRARMIGHGDTRGTQNWTRILAAIHKLQTQAERQNASALHRALVASTCQ